MRRKESLLLLKNMADQLPINPDVELFRWGPVPVRLFYGADFLEGIFGKGHYRKAYEFHWPDGMALCRGKQFVFVNEFSPMREVGTKLFLKYMLPLDMRATVREKWLYDLETLRRIEKEIDATNIPNLSDAAFLALWKRLHAATIGFWTHITVPELANYGSPTLLEEKLRACITDTQELSKAMEILTAPEHSSFYQQEELELFKTDDIAAHTKKYFWLKNSYESVEVLDESFFAERKGKLEADLPELLIEAQRNARERKEELQKKYNLSSEVMDVAAALVAGIEWQDERKADIFIYLHYKELLLAEVARRFGWEMDALRNIRELEIEKMVRERHVPPDMLERTQATGLLCFGEEISVISPETALRYWDMYAHEKVQETSELKGIVASRGAGSIVRGKAKILLDPKAGSVEPGEILIASMTSPEYIFSMKNAVAIITDTGGLTSHAAIVSRELGTPCIVNTKAATRIFKDGDILEVNTEKGTVRKQK
jgi:phosphoenolpyruvate synthase/pyruvate phosphate dikinase